VEGPEVKYTYRREPKKPDSSGWGRGVRKMDEPNKKTTFHSRLCSCRKENYCLVQYLSDKYGETAQKYALGLKASTYTNVFEWLNPVQEVNRININN
jgi:hypothetical protein